MRNPSQHIKSDEQRKAIFANLREHGLIGSTQRGFRKYARRKPLHGELIIGGLTAAAGIYATRKLRAVKALSSWVGRGAVTAKGLRRVANPRQWTNFRDIALEAPVFYGADLAIRRALGGPSQKRDYERSTRGAGAAVVGGMGAEALVRSGISFARTRGGQFAFQHGRRLGGLTIRKTLQFGTRGTKAAYRGSKSLYRRYWR